MLSINHAGRWLATATLLCAATTASAAENWADWKERMPIRLDRADQETIGLLPIDATISLKASRMSDPNDPSKEFRLVYDAGKGGMQEVPFQLSRVSLWAQADTEGTTLSVPTLNAMVSFFPVEGDQAGTYTLLYNNAAAKPAQYETDLKVSGEGPAWTIENSKIKVELAKGHEGRSKSNMHDYFGDSGQLGVVTVKSRPGVEITNPNKSLHWNPGIFIPKRGWIHAYAWDPPAEYEIEQGPIFVEVRRRGPFPLIPEVDMAITYRFFKERDFIESGTRMDVVKEFATVSIRNNCLVFSDSLFSRMAWPQGDQVRDEAINDYTPVNRHGDLIRVEPGLPWFTIYNPETKVGAATVMLEEMNVGPWGGPQTYFDHAFYFTHGHNLLYWFRPQAYFLIDWDRQQLITIPEGSVYAERNIYRFYDTEDGGATEGVEALARAAAHRPDIKVGPYIFAPAE